MYFIFVSTDSEIRAKHYDELLGIYHKSLKDLLNHMGGDTMSQFPFTAFSRQLKAFGKFGILMGVFLIPLVTTRNEDLPDMDEMAEKFKNITADEIADMSMIGSQESYNFRMNGSINDSVKYGYI